MKSTNKGRILYLARLLYEETDDAGHTLSTQELIARLAEAGYKANRKTVRDDVDTLAACGVKVATEKRGRNEFYIAERLLELSELKLLIDAVLASKFITRAKSKVLIEKLSSMASRHQVGDLTRHLYTEEAIKPNNESIYTIVDRISDAINQKKKICFKYYEYTAEKKKVLRNGGELYVNSPYAMLWNDDRYYMLGYSDKHDKIVQFRVDRMKQPIISSEKAVPPPQGFSVASYVRRVFRMYGGEETVLTMECDNSLMKTVVDRFGEDVKTAIASDDTFRATVKVFLSPTFYAWVFQFGGQIRIVSPQCAVLAYREMAMQALRSVYESTTGIQQ